MAQPKPLPSNPTNADLAQSHVQLHECVEELKADTAAGFLEARTERSRIAEDIAATHAKVRLLSGQIKALIDDKILTDEAADNNFASVELNQMKIMHRLGIKSDSTKIQPASLLSLSPAKLVPIAVGVATVSGSIIAGLLALYGKLAPLLH